MPTFDRTRIIRDLPGGEYIYLAAKFVTELKRSARTEMRRAADDFADVAETARSVQGQIYPIIDGVRQHPLISNGERLTKTVRNASEDLAREVVGEKRPFHIPGSVLVYWNPAANRDKSKKAKDDLVEEFRALGLNEKSWDDGTIVFDHQNVGSSRRVIDGSIAFRSTLEDPDERLEDMVAHVEALLEVDPGQRVVVVGIGGDRTVDDVAVAVQMVKEKSNPGEGPRHVLPAGKKGGTANDLCCITGTPKGTRAFLNFLGDGVETPLQGLRFTLGSRVSDGVSQRSFYGSTWGESGALFKRLEAVKVERKKRGGSVSVLDYLLLLPKTILDSRIIQVKGVILRKDGSEEYINDGEPIKCGEVFGPLVTHQLGGVTKMPFMKSGAMVYLAPPYPFGVTPFLEPFVRNVFALAGFQGAIQLFGRVLTLNDERQIHLEPGDGIGFEFFEEDAKTRLKVLGTLAGDVVGPESVVTAKVVEPINFLSDPQCDLRVQQGLAKPSVPGYRFLSMARTWVMSGIRAFSGVKRC
jgi:hypothetical protein